MQQAWSKRWITLKYIYPVPAALCRTHMPLPCGTGNNHGMASSTASLGPESLTQQHRSAHLEQDHHMALGGGREQLEAEVLPEPVPMRGRLLQHVVRVILHAPGMHGPCQLLALLQCRPEGTAASRPRGDETPGGSASARPRQAMLPTPQLKDWLVSHAQLCTATRHMWRAALHVTRSCCCSTAQE